MAARRALRTPRAPLSWVAPPPRCRISPGPPQNGIQAAVAAEALTEDSLHHKGLILAHTLRVEQQSYGVMLLAQPSEPGSVQPATKIGKGEGNARLTRQVANDAARLNDFTLCIRPREILQPAMAATVRADRKAVRVQLAQLPGREVRLCLLQVASSVNTEARQQTLEPRLLARRQLQQPAQERHQPRVHITVEIGDTERERRGRLRQGSTRARSQ